MGSTSRSLVHDAQDDSQHDTQPTGECWARCTSSGGQPYVALEAQLGARHGHRPPVAPVVSNRRDGVRHTTRRCATSG